MNTLRDWLQHADPVAREHPLTEEDAQRMRRVVLAAVEERPRLLIWRHSVWAAATVAVALVAVAGVARWWRPAAEDPAIVERGSDSSHQRVDSSTRRQLLFATPGGTRVIWVFTPDFKP
jgi:hypothetical protein